MSKKTWWTFSILTTIILILTLIFLWFQKSQYRFQPTELVDRSETQKYLSENWEPINDWLGEPTIRVPTGIYVKSAEFKTANDVRLTGIAWQRYSPEKHDSISSEERGIVFADAVSSSITESYRKKLGNEEVIGWSFDVVLRQSFKYVNYPFDHKIIWVQLWSNTFNRNVILVPDFDSYKSTGLEDTFGIDEGIVLGTWTRQETFFDYRIATYDTTFGVGAYPEQERKFVNLTYNIVLQRKFQNAFIINFVPLFVVAMLLFALVMMVTGDEKKTGKFGFSTSGTIGSCSSLFFVVMLSHIQLRSEFSSVGVVFMEYSYFLMYLMILLVALNTFMFSLGWSSRWGIIPYKDNLIPKIIFWPLIFGMMVTITLITL
ncbi:hypothetical protein QUF74_04935 [Candidatus Halobeggiatoa sp. HSG11]|nr:hypothetical protein [Candidatus Halobeggiatoa sp. HSG11]